jgi:hypothetical protein
MRMQCGLLQSVWTYGRWHVAYGASQPVLAPYASYEVQLDMRLVNAIRLEYVFGRAAGFVDCYH